MATSGSKDGSGSSNSGDSDNSGGSNNDGGGDKSGDGGGSNGDSAGGGGPGDTNPTGTSLTDLTGDLKKFAESGSPNLNLTPEARNACLDLIRRYRGELAAQRKEMDSVDHMGEVGGLDSARQTKANLLYDINGPGGAKDMMQKCIDYLDQLEASVGKSAAKIEQDG